jgi:hypothetical protein
LTETRYRIGIDPGGDPVGDLCRGSLKSLELILLKQLGCFGMKVSAIGVHAVVAAKRFSQTEIAPNISTFIFPAKNAERHGRFAWRKVMSNCASAAVMPAEKSGGFG